jgi:hypothetical protein
MSLDINVFIEKSRMISPSDWQSHLDQEGFPLQLYPDFDPFKFSGMLPCEFDGEEAGFEYYFDVLEDTMFNPDSTRGGIYINADWGKHFNIRVNHNYRNLAINAGNIFTANQTDIRMSYQFNIRQRLRLALIHTDINRDLSLYNNPDDFNQNSERMATQLIYSYKVNPRTLLFLGYSDAGTEFDDIDSFTKTNKSVFVKFSYAFKR